MPFTVRPNGDIVCDTADEALALAQRLRKEPTAAAPVVGESISTDRWKAVHANDKRITAAVERLKAGREFFPDLTPLQRQVCEMRIAGKWPSEIGKELGRTTGTVQAIIWDAQKRLTRRALGEPILTQAEISSMGGRAAKAKRAAAIEEEKQQAPADAVKQPTETIPEVFQPAAPARRSVTCGKCGGAGHNARTCRGAAPAEPPTAEPLAPAPPPVAARLFIVCEDFEEDDGTAWIDGDVWEALEPTGETVDDHQQWTMRRQGDGAEGVGFPSLHPFVPHDPAAATRAPNIPRVGMGLGARSAA